MTVAIVRSETGLSDSEDITMSTNAQPSEMKGSFETDATTGCAGHMLERRETTSRGAG